jgi:ABC-type transporter Mla MlaB component
MQPIAVPARIDAGNAVEVLNSLKEATTAAGSLPVTLDLAPLQQFDSSALSLLLQLARDRSGSVHGAETTAEPRAAATPGETPAMTPFLVLLNPPEKLQELAELYGVAEMLFGAAVEPDHGRQN